MSSSSSPAPLKGLGLLLLFGIMSSVHGEKLAESRSMIQELRGVLAELTEEGRSFLGRTIGEQTVRSVHKAFSQVLTLIAGSLASGLNVLMKYVSQLLQTAGLSVNLPIQSVTPEGVIFVAQWVILALIGYILLSLTLQLISSTLRRALWLLKVGVALAFFVLILSDHSATSENTAIRLAVLVFVCVLLGVGRRRSSEAEDKTAHLEEQVRILERRLREMERRRRDEK